MTAPTGQSYVPVMVSVALHAVADPDIAHEAEPAFEAQLTSHKQSHVSLDVAFDLHTCPSQFCLVQQACKGKNHAATCWPYAALEPRCWEHQACTYDRSASSFLLYISGHGNANMTIIAHRCVHDILHLEVESD